MEGISHFVSPYIIISIIALLIGIYQFTQEKMTLRYFLLFLIYSLVMEVIVNFLLYKYQKSSLAMYSYYAFSCTLYYIYLYYLHFKTKNWTHYLLGVTTLLIIVSLYIFYKSEETFVPLPYFLGLGVTIVLIFKYFYDILYVDPYRNIKYEAIFYLSLGLLLFAFTTFPIMAFIKVLVLDERTSKRFAEILQYGNIFISLGYLGVILCAKKS